ncbi:hypothetical protein [Microbacterium sp. NPDC087589]|uniref:hypothetical protein n=1 Tax=Microbacterium sp. NPDC087589 TaxID=3364191 RepID=UPI00381C1632
MAETEARPRGVMLVPGAHRVIRRIDPGEGPYAGTLVTRGGSVAVQVDAESISGWAGWEHAGDDHVAGPLDIVRRSDGHDVLLPWCTERVSSFVGRRAAADAALSTGELTTLVASILRGLGELARAPRLGETGEWWLTDDGRPTFVIGTGETAQVAAAALVARLRKDCTDRTLGRLLVVIEEGLSADTARPGMPLRQLEKWEAELFDTAAPKPLRRDVHAPELARDVDAARHAVAARPDMRGQPRSRSSLPREASRVEALSSRIAVVLMQRLGAWRAALARPIERRTGRSAHGGSVRREHMAESGAAANGRAPAKRGRRTIVAVSAAAVVLAGGLLWPGGATGEPEERGATAVPKSSPRATEVAPAVADSSPTPSPPSPEPDAPPGEGSPRDGSEPVSPAEAARMLLSAISICGENDDKVCDGAVAQGSVGVVDALRGVSDGALQLEPVDEYGDVAVIRVTTSQDSDSTQSDTGERMVVLVRMAEKWLVRDVYDVADQPG